MIFECCSHLLSKGQLSEINKYFSLLNSLKVDFNKFPIDFSFFDFCQKALDPKAFAKLFIEYFSFHGSLEPYIDTCLKKLIRLVNKDPEESQQYLELALQLVKKFPISSPLFIDVIKLAATFSSKMQLKIFYLLFEKLDPSKRQKIKAKTLAICLLSVLREKIPIEDKPLLDLVRNPYFISLHKEIPARLESLIFQKIIFLCLREKRKKIALVEIGKSLPETVFKLAPIKIELRLKYVHLLLLWGKDVYAINLITNILKENLNDSSQKIIGNLISEIYESATPHGENDDNTVQRIGLIWALKEYFHIPFSRLFILLYLSKIPKGFLEDKVYYLQDLLRQRKAEEMPDKDASSMKNALQLILKELISDYSKVSEARMLLQDKNLVFYLTRAIICDLRQKAMLTKVPRFILASLGAQAVEIDKKMDELAIYRLKEFRTGTKLTRKKRLLEGQLNIQFTQVTNKIKEECYRKILIVGIISSLSIAVFSAIGIVYLEFLQSLEH